MTSSGINRYYDRIRAKNIWILNKHPSPLNSSVISPPPPPPSNNRKETLRVFALLIRNYFKVRIISLKSRPDEYNNSYNIIQLWCCMKCCTRLATLLYRVVSCCMKFDRATKLFNWTNVVRYNISFVFRDVVWCTRLATPCKFVMLCCIYFWRNVVSCCKKCCIRLATLLLNMIKQHETMCNKCCMIFYEMLYSFGLGLMGRIVLAECKTRVFRTPVFSYWSLLRIG